MSGLCREIRERIVYMKQCANCGSRFPVVKCREFREKGQRSIVLCRTCAYQEAKKVNEILGIIIPVIVPFVRRKRYNEFGVSYI